MVKTKAILILVVLATLAIPAVADEVDDLILDLKFGQSDIRMVAAEGLGEIGDPRAVDPLIDALADDSGDVRCTAAETLGKIGDPKAVDPLICVLRDESRRNSQSSAARALGMIGDPRAVDPLIDVLNNEDLWWVHSDAAWALGWIGVSDPRAISGLVNLTRTTGSGHAARWRAKCALAMLGESWVYESIIDGFKGDLEISSYTYPTWDVQIEAAKTLGKMGDHGQIEALTYMLQSDRSMTSQIYWSAWALAMLGDPIGIDTLIDALDDGWIDNSYGVDYEVEDPLVPYWTDNKIWIQFNTILALSELGDERACIPLANVALYTQNNRVREAAAEALEKIQTGHAEDIQAFDEAIKLDPDDAGAWFNKGDALSDQGRYDEAIDAFDETIRLDPENAGAWFNKGKALGDQGRYDEAIEAFDEAIRLDPDDAGAWLYKGNALCVTGKYDEAIQAYDEAIRIDPKLALAWNNKGLTLYEMGEYTEADVAVAIAREIQAGRW